MWKAIVYHHVVNKSRFKAVADQFHYVVDDEISDLLMDLAEYYRKKDRKKPNRILIFEVKEALDSGRQKA